MNFERSLKKAGISIDSNKPILNGEEFSIRMYEDELLLKGIEDELSKGKTVKQILQKCENIYEMNRFGLEDLKFIENQLNQLNVLNQQDKFTTDKENYNKQGIYNKQRNQQDLANPAQQHLANPAQQTNKQTNQQTNKPTNQLTNQQTNQLPKVKVQNWIDVIDYEECYDEVEDMNPIVIGCDGYETQFDADTNQDAITPLIFVNARTCQVERPKGYFIGLNGTVYRYTKRTKQYKPRKSDWSSKGYLRCRLVGLEAKISGALYSSWFDSEYDNPMCSTDREDKLPTVLNIIKLGTYKGKGGN